MPQTTMNRVLKSLVLVILLTSMAESSQAQTAKFAWSFQDVSVGQLPAGWQVAGTNQRGPLATWRIIVDKTATGSDHVLALTKNKSRKSVNYSPIHTTSSTVLIGRKSLWPTALLERG